MPLNNALSKISKLTEYLMMSNKDYSEIGLQTSNDLATSGHTPSMSNELRILNDLNARVVRMECRLVQLMLFLGVDIYAPTEPQTSHQPS
jgi:hypothetical protein